MLLDNKAPMLRQDTSYVDDSLDATDKNTIKKEIDKCFRRIAILSNYKERCSEELRYRLIRIEKFDEKIFESSLIKAKKYGIVDDNRYAKIYLFTKTQSLKGVDGIKRHFDKMKIDYRSNMDLCKMMDDAVEKENMSAFKYINKHPSSSKNLFAGNVNKLINRGFSLDIAVSASKKYLTLNKNTNNF